MGMGLRGVERIEAEREEVEWERKERELGREEVRWEWKKRKRSEKKIRRKGRRKRGRGRE